MVCERKRGITDDSKVFIPSNNWKDRVSTYQEREDFKQTRFGQKNKHLVLEVLTSLGILTFKRLCQADNETYRSGVQGRSRYQICESPPAALFLNQRHWMRPSN